MYLFINKKREQVLTSLHRNGFVPVLILQYRFVLTNHQLLLRSISFSSAVADVLQHLMPECSLHHSHRRESSSGQGPPHGRFLAQASLP